MRNNWFILPAVLYCIVFTWLFSGYQYLIDPDSTGYIKVTERVMAGDYFRSINGCWSPLNSWLIIPFVKAGLTPVIAAKVCNGIFGLAALLALFALVKKFKLTDLLQQAILFTAAILFVQFAYSQLFGDLLQLTLLLIYLNIICSKDYINSNGKIALSAFVAGIAYYAKYYSFYFALAHLAVVIFLLLKQQQQVQLFKAWLIKTSIAIVSLLLTILPWVIALTKKYGYLTMANTGKINQAWFLGGAYQQQKIMIQPLPYPDSYSFWDDPSVWKGVYINAFTSKAVFVQQLKLIVNNVQLYFRFLNDFSFLAVLLLLLSCYFLISKRTKQFQTTPNISLLTAALIMPLGYLLIIIEHRYVWLVAVCLLIFAGVLVSALQEKLQMNKRLLRFAVVICFGSFCIYPITQLHDNNNHGKTAALMADAFRQHNISGRIISNPANNAEQEQSLALCYLLKSQCYGPSAVEFTQSEILEAIRQNHIDHYIVYYHRSWEKEMILSSELARQARSVQTDVFPGLIVLSF